MEYLETLKKLKKDIIKKTIISFVFSFLIYVMIVVDSILKNDFNLISILWGLPLFLIGGFMLSFLLNSSDRKEYEKIYKKNLVLEIFKQNFTDLVYEPDKEMSSEVIKNSEMIGVFDEYMAEDYINAKYKGINFEYSDIMAQKETYKGGDGKEYDTLFHGQWLIFDFNKEFKTNIKLYDSQYKSLKKANNKNYKEIQMEDSEFNNKFKIYAESEIETFYILTPSMMDKIKELKSKMNDELLFCFKNNKLHIGLNSGINLFEPHIYAKLNVQEDKEIIQKQIKNITEFVDILNLDNDLFKRR